MLVDTHCHVHDARFEDDREQAIARARATKVSAMICVGCDLETTKRAQALAQIHADIFFSAGFHPHEAKEANADFIDALRAFARDPKCVGIGEAGLDYYYDHSPRETQAQVFVAQAKLAAELNKPLIIHVRDAFDECLDLLKPVANLRTVVIHCFTGSLEVAKRIVDLGYYISISGIVTFKNPGELDQVVVQIPLDRLLIETDSPYLAPLPYRGKRNEPAYVVKVAEKIAELRGISVDEVARVTSENAKRVFGL